MFKRSDLKFYLLELNGISLCDLSEFCKKYSIDLCYALSRELVGCIERFVRLAVYLDYVYRGKSYSDCVHACNIKWREILKILDMDFDTAYIDD